MKNNFHFPVKAVLAFACFFTSASALNAQGAAGTDDDGFILRITSPASIAQDLRTDEGNCGWLGSVYGPSVTEDFCGDVVWAYPDSLGCTPLPAGSLTGKIAFVRRGICTFSLKVYNAQQAGAKAVIIANHYLNTALGDGPCIAYLPTGVVLGGMLGVDSAALVNIPSVFIHRKTAEEIDGALGAGQAVEVCFTLPRVIDPYAAYHYATPVSQVTTLENIGFNVFNRGTAAMDDLVIKADIHEPGGNVTTLETTAQAIDPATDALVFFPAYTPPAVKGEFEIVYSNNKFTESRDTLRRKFVQTDYTWAMDNLVIQADGGAMRNDLFAPTLKYQIGSLIFSGNNGGTAKYATFGIANIDSVYDATKPLGNQIAVIFYDADSDGNGDLNLTGSFEDDLGGDALGLTTYQMTGNEKETTLIDVPILDFNNPLDTGVALLADHSYYITVLYNGEENGSGRNCAFTNGSYQDYLAYRNEAQTFISSNPMLIGTSFSSWGDRTVITRLQLDGYTPSSNTNQPVLLSTTQYSVMPNPANEHLRLNLDLAEQNSQVRVSIMSGLGRTLRSQSFKDFQSGQLNFDVRDIPSGTYLMWIQTVEGQAVTKVTICH